MSVTTTTPSLDIYRGGRFSLLTQHGKESVVTPLFREMLDATVELTTGFDTDTLGTFTRDVARLGNQLEAARTKANKGMELLGLPCGIASEGSFGPDPFGLFAWNVELMILVDRPRGIEIVGLAQGPAQDHHGRVSTLEALESFARGARFPDHGLVVRPDDDRDPRVRKGLTDWPALHEAFEQALAQSQNATVFIESDLRAHMNPTRMAVIRQAAENLIQRMRSECPSCSLPGYWRVERILGLPCRDCGSPTNEARAERWRCVAGDHQEVRELSPGALGDPVRCNDCNP